MHGIPMSFRAESSERGIPTVFIHINGWDSSEDLGMTYGRRWQKSQQSYLHDKLFATLS